MMFMRKILAVVFLLTAVIVFHRLIKIALGSVPSKASIKIFDSWRK